VNKCIDCKWCDRGVEHGIFVRQFNDVCTNKAAYHNRWFWCGFYPKCSHMRKRYGDDCPYFVESLVTCVEEYLESMDNHSFSEVLKGHDMYPPTIKLIVKKEFDCQGGEYLNQKEATVTVDVSDKYIYLQVDEENGNAVCYTIPKKVLE
jgi:hypothetical protein